MSHNNIFIKKKPGNRCQLLLLCNIQTVYFNNNKKYMNMVILNSVNKIIFFSMMKITYLYLNKDCLCNRVK